MEQKPTPEHIQKADIEGSTEEKQDLIKTRRFKNTDRGTEIEFATISLDDAKSIQEEDIDRILKEKFGENAYFPMNRKSEIAHFLNDQDAETMLLMIADKSEERDRGGGYGSAKYLTLRKIGEKLLITPAPFVHDLFFGGKNSINHFEDIKSILEQGFIRPYKDSIEENVMVKGVIKGTKKEHRMNLVGSGNSPFVAKEGITKGDAFSLELYGDSGSGHTSTITGYRDSPLGAQLVYNLKEASPQRILSINIRINPEASEAEQGKKIEFYKEQITQVYNIPIRFFTLNQEPVDGDPATKIEKLRLNRIFPKGNTDRDGSEQSGE